MQRSVEAACAALVLIVCAASGARAQNAAACQSVEFGKDVLERFPQIRAACLDVITRDNQSYAVLRSVLTRVSRDSISVRFKMPDGSRGESRSFSVDPGFRVLVQGQPTRVEDLAIGEELNAYVKVTEPMIALQPAADDEQLDLYPLTSEEPTPPVQEAVAVAVLPQTASALPAVLASGLVCALIGCMLSVWRRMPARSLTRDPRSGE